MDSFGNSEGDDFDRRRSDRRRRRSDSRGRQHRGNVGGLYGPHRYHPFHQYVSSGNQVCPIVTTYADQRSSLLYQPPVTTAIQQDLYGLQRIALFPRYDGDGSEYCPIVTTYDDVRSSLLYQPPVTATFRRANAYLGGDAEELGAVGGFEPIDRHLTGDVNRVNLAIPGPISLQATTLSSLTEGVRRMRLRISDHNHPGDFTATSFAPQGSDFHPVYVRPQRTTYHQVALDWPASTATSVFNQWLSSSRGQNSLPLVTSGHEYNRCPFRGLRHYFPGTPPRRGRCQGRRRISPATASDNFLEPAFPRSSNIDVIDPELEVYLESPRVDISSATISRWNTTRASESMQLSTRSTVLSPELTWSWSPTVYTGPPIPMRSLGMSGMSIIMQPLSTILSDIYQSSSIPVVRLADDSSISIEAPLRDDSNIPLAARPLPMISSWSHPGYRISSAVQSVEPIRRIERPDQIGYWTPTGEFVPLNARAVTWTPITSLGLSGTALVVCWLELGNEISVGELYGLPNDEDSRFGQIRSRSSQGLREYRMRFRTWESCRRYTQRFQTWSYYREQNILFRSLGSPVRDRSRFESQESPRNDGGNNRSLDGPPEQRMRYESPKSSPQPSPTFRSRESPPHGVHQSRDSPPEQPTRQEPQESLRRRRPRDCKSSRTTQRSKSLDAPPRIRPRRPRHKSSESKRARKSSGSRLKLRNLFGIFKKSPKSDKQSRTGGPTPSKQGTECEKPTSSRFQQRNDIPPWERSTDLTVDTTVNIETAPSSKDGKSTSKSRFETKDDKDRRKRKGEKPESDHSKRHLFSLPCKKFVKGVVPSHSFDYISHLSENHDEQAGPSDRAPISDIMDEAAIAQLEKYVADQLVENIRQSNVERRQAPILDERFELEPYRYISLDTPKHLDGDANQTGSGHVGGARPETKFYRPSGRDLAENQRDRQPVGGTCPKIRRDSALHKKKRCGESVVHLKSTSPSSSSDPPRRTQRPTGRGRELSDPRDLTSQITRPITMQQQRPSRRRRKKRRERARSSRIPHSSSSDSLALAGAVGGARRPRDRCVKKSKKAVPTPQSRYPRPTVLQLHDGKWKKLFSPSETELAAEFPPQLPGEDTPLSTRMPASPAPVLYIIPDDYGVEYEHLTSSRFQQRNDIPPWERSTDLTAGNIEEKENVTSSEDEKSASKSRFETKDDQDRRKRKGGEPESDHSKRQLLSPPSGPFLMGDIVPSRSFEYLSGISENRSEQAGPSDRAQKSDIMDEAAQAQLARNMQQSNVQRRQPRAYEPFEPPPYPFGRFDNTKRRDGDANQTGSKPVGGARPKTKSHRPSGRDLAENQRDSQPVGGACPNIRRDSALSKKKRCGESVVHLKSTSPSSSSDPPRRTQRLTGRDGELLDARDMTSCMKRPITMPDQQPAHRRRKKEFLKRRARARSSEIPRTPSSDWLPSEGAVGGARTSRDRYGRERKRAVSTPQSRNPRLKALQRHGSEWKKLFIFSPTDVVSEYPPELPGEGYDSLSLMEKRENPPPSMGRWKTVDVTSYMKNMAYSCFKVQEYEIAYRLLRKVQERVGLDYDVLLLRTEVQFYLGFDEPGEPAIVVLVGRHNAVSELQIERCCEILLDENRPLAAVLLAAAGCRRHRVRERGRNDWLRGHMFFHFAEKAFTIIRQVIPKTIIRRFMMTLSDEVERNLDYYRPKFPQHYRRIQQCRIACQTGLSSYLERYRNQTWV